MRLGAGLVWVWVWLDLAGALPVWPVVACSGWALCAIKREVQEPRNAKSKEKELKAEREQLSEQ